MKKAIIFVAVGIVFSVWVLKAQESHFAGSIQNILRKESVNVEVSSFTLPFTSLVSTSTTGKAILIKGDKMTSVNVLIVGNVIFGSPYIEISGVDVMKANMLNGQ